MIQILAGAMMVATRLKEPETDFETGRARRSALSDLPKERTRKRKFWCFGRQDNDV